MSLSAVAERYARAIFDLGQEQGQSSGVTDQVVRFAETYAGSDALSAVLDNPLVEPETRETILVETAGRLGVRETALNALRLLAARHRLAALPYIARRLMTLADEKAGVVRASVTSAVPLGEPYYKRLSALLSTALECQVVLETKQDPALIGGVVTRIGDSVIDGSVQGRLQELERRLSHQA